MLKKSNSDGTPKITCDNADCEKDEHCFRPTRSSKSWQDPPGSCMHCGESPVDWSRVRRRDTSDFDALAAELRKEWISRLLKKA